MQQSSKGKPAVFKCTVNEIKVKELPEADDEFAKDVSEFDTLAEYKDDIRAKLLEKKTADAKREKQNKTVAKAVENAHDGDSGGYDYRAGKKNGRRLRKKTAVSGSFYGSVHAVHWSDHGCCWTADASGGTQAHPEQPGT